MKFSRNTLAFMSVLAAGVLLATATFVLPSTTTFGNETDAAAAADALARELAQSAYLNKGSSAPSSSAPTTQAPAPPAAPLDNNPATGGTGNAGATGNAPAGLPSTGSGGYLNSESSTNYGFLLIGLGVAMMGSGSLVWAVSRRRR